MSRALAILAIAILSGSLFAQVSPMAPEAAQVPIIEGPRIELANEHLTIITWTTKNPGGSPVHYGVVHYGTDPNSLIETAKSPIRLNPDHSLTVFAGALIISGHKLPTTTRLIRCRPPARAMG
jgi:hypothetical protein